MELFPFYRKKNQLWLRKNNGRAGFKTEFLYLWNPAYFVPHAASQDILAHPVDPKNKMVFQIQTILHLFTFGTEDADIENYLTRQPIIVRIEG